MPFPGAADAGQHFIAKCRHGVVVSQCRCAGSKMTRIVECPPSCEENRQEQGEE